MRYEHYKEPSQREAAKDNSVNVYLDYKAEQYSSMYVGICVYTLISRELPKIQKWKITKIECTFQIQGKTSLE